MRGAMAALTLVVGSTSMLSACAPMIVGGAVMGGLVASDRRTSGAQLEDERIELRGTNLVKEHLGERVHVTVSSYNRQVLLTGEVPSLQDRQLAEQVVARVENVRSIINELGVLGNSTLMQRSSDALVTGRVKAGLVDARDLQSNAFKVVTERGTTYLMGRVTQAEADVGTQIARNTSGVQKVVRVFELISEDELRALQPKSASR